jgi:hypothetical protein
MRKVHWSPCGDDSGGSRTDGSNQIAGTDKVLQQGLAKLVTTTLPVRSQHPMIMGSCDQMIIAYR